MTPHLLRLTDVGAAALADAVAGGPAVEITHVALGSGAGPLTGAETALGIEVARVPVGASRVVDAVATVGAEFPVGSVAADRSVREVGLFDADGRLIFHAAVAPGATLGALTPATAYAVSLQVALKAAPDGVIVFVEADPPSELLLLSRVSALEVQLARLKDASWRNLFLAQS